MSTFTNHQRTFGFTLIEVLLVIVVVGIMVAAIQINFTSNKPEAQLEQESTRFANVFNLAAEFSLLNNIELGLVVTPEGYQFVGYDGVRWSTVPDNEMLAPYQLPEGLLMSLEFDDLAIDPASLIDADLFTPDEEAIEQMEEGLEEGEKPLIPQVFLMSGGDITPFRVVFNFEDEFLLEQELSYAVTGLYTTPVTVVGPILDGEYPEEGQADD